MHGDNSCMFIRSNKVTSSNGTVHEYVRVVAAVRDNGKTKQKVIANLGRRDTLEAILPLLKRFLHGDDDQQQLAEQLRAEGPIDVRDASTWGPALVVRALWQQLGLWNILDNMRRRPRPIPEDDPQDDWVSRVLVLVTNRLTHPSSEHGLARWLESDFLCDRLGRRYLPVWQQHGRVQVSFTQLTRWYRTLDHLILNKDDIEVALYQRLRDLFDFQPELVFYDLTSTYFEGRGPALAKHGYSRDGRPRNVQVVVGVVMVAGWPIAHHVWAGNTRDVKTVPDVLADLRKRFAFRRVVFVGDRGMVSQRNFEALQGKLVEQPPSGNQQMAADQRPAADSEPRCESVANDSADSVAARHTTAANQEPISRDPEAPFGFLLGMVRRRNPEVEQLLDRVRDDAWIDCPSGITAQEHSPPPKTRVQEVPCDRPGVRVFVVDSEERRQYEERMRTRSMQRALATLEKVQRRVATRRLVDPSKIGAAVSRAMQRHHAHRYYDWELRDGQLHIGEHPVHLAREKKYEGRYLIQSDQEDMTPLEAVANYKQLADVERGFHCLKDPLALRPIHHRTDHRVQAHIFVAALAFLIDRLLEHRLKAAQSNLSTADAWSALTTIRHVTFQVGDELRSGVTPGSTRARQILNALGLTDLRPPTAPGGESTTM